MLLKLAKEQPDTSKLQDWLSRVTAWRWYVQSDGTPTVVRRSFLGWFLTPAYHLVTWARWKLGRGPECGDEFCYETEHWPGGRVRYPDLG